MYVWQNLKHVQDRLKYEKFSNANDLNLDYDQNFVKLGKQSKSCQRELNYSQF